MDKVYMVLDGIEITSQEQLEELIIDLPEESQIALRNIFDESAQHIDQP